MSEAETFNHLFLLTYLSFLSKTATHLFVSMNFIIEQYSTVTVNHGSIMKSEKIQTHLLSYPNQTNTLFNTLKALVSMKGHHNI